MKTEPMMQGYPKIKNRSAHILVMGSIVVIAALVVSGIRPFDRLTWWMEVLPAMIMLPVLWWTFSRYPLTSLLYICVFMHAIVLIYGGKYSYARVPLGFQIQEWFDLARNPYDKIGHFFQGFVPVMIGREILIRGSYIRGRKMLNFLVVCIALAISAVYELIEWTAALVMGQGADEFLGTQGDVWDTQADMFFAFIGATLALLVLSSLHDRQINGLTKDQ